MRGLWLALLTGGALFAQTAPRDLVRLSIRNGEQSWRESFDYSYVKRDVDRQMDSTGRLKSSAVDVYDIIPLGYGAFFEQQMEHDGEPLSVEERLKIARELEKRRAESPAQKRRRFEKELAERSYLEEVPDAFDFKLTGEENLATGPAWRGKIELQREQEKPALTASGFRRFPVSPGIARSEKSCGWKQLPDSWACGGAGLRSRAPV